jgi:purine-nucleoside phosphorylase
MNDVPHNHPWWDDLSPAVEAIRSKLSRVKDPPPEGSLDALIVLGSGLGDVVSRWPSVTSWRPGEIRGAVPSTVSGHAGTFHWVRIGERNVLIQKGRVHLYEGGGLASVLFATRLAYRLGARWLLLTNAAGGLDPSLEPGMVLILEDQISLFLGRALGKRNASRPEGCIPRGSPFDQGWVHRLSHVADELEIATRRGVLAGGLGPTYETAAEVEAMRRLGATAGTMSTVMEALEGRSLGMRVGGISCITNMATGMSSTPLDHHEVLVLGRRCSQWVGELLDRALLEGPDDSV